MAALSDYLESGLLNHVFRDHSFSKPTNIAIALCSGVPRDSDTGVSCYQDPTGGSLWELPSGDENGNDTGYRRLSLGNPTSLGNTYWSFTDEDHAAGSGIIKNASSFMFDTGEGSAALVDWGWVSGIAIVDSGEYGTGNLLMHAALTNPRVIYQGDTVKFDTSTLQITFK
tara:strand:+ start:771 stop:1280 length:510 start_codon:yes stop_codon:yes gene_type:complete